VDYDPTVVGDVHAALTEVGEQALLEAVERLPAHR